MPKASLAPEDGSKPLVFRFNPKELSVNKAATWNRPTNKGAKHSSKPEFQGVQPQAVTMELFFDDWYEDDGDLVKDIELLTSWLKPTDKSITDKKPQPRALKFQWGSGPLSAFKGFLKSVNVKYTLFKADGTPIRATAQIALEEIPVDPGKQNPTSGAVTGRRAHVMAAGDSLHSVAFREYDDPALWRGLAVLNGIDDPLRVTPGTRLLIPTADEAAAAAS